MANRAEQVAANSLEGTITKDLKTQLPESLRKLGGEANITLMVQDHQEVTIIIRTVRKRVSKESEVTFQSICPRSREGYYAFEGDFHFPLKMTKFTRVG